MAAATAVSFTIFGGRGFVGGALARHLGSRGHDVACPARNDHGRGRHLGHAVYAIGLTADFRTRPFDTAQAHVAVLADVLAHAEFDSFLFLSSTRVYRDACTDEDAPLRVRPQDPDDLYNATKIAGEALCLALRNPTIRVARLANVVGAESHGDDFLGAVLRDAASGTVELRTGLDSAKDYISVNDVSFALEAIALKGRSRLYNVASGRNTTHRAIADRLTALGVRVDVAAQAPTTIAHPINTHRLVGEFGQRAGDVLDLLPGLYAAAVARHKGRPAPPGALLP